MFNQTQTLGDYENLLNLLNMTSSELIELITSSDSLFTNYMKAMVFMPIYEHYSALGLCSLGSEISFCTNKELTYNQWINQAILMNPPESLGINATNESYVRAFPAWTSLHFTPELGYFLNKA